MLFFWKKNKLVDNFAIKLADELYSQVPPDILQIATGGKEKKLAQRWEKEVQSTLVRLRDFKASYRLGVYGKARLHLTFMERLRSHGYAEEIIKQLNDYLLVKTP